MYNSPFHSVLLQINNSSFIAVNGEKKAIIKEPTFEYNFVLRSLTDEHCQLLV
jgi:hypothetical protein